jgi:hypothetical protein
MIAYWIFRQLYKTSGFWQRYAPVRCAHSSSEKHYEYLHAALEEWYEGLKGRGEGGVEYVLSLHVGLAHCPRVQAEQRAVPSHLEQGKN